MKLVLKRLLVTILSIYIGLLTFEIYLALRQKLWELKKDKIFGTLEARSKVEQKTGLPTCVNGGFFRYFPETITPDFPIGTESFTWYLGFNEGLGYPSNITDRYGFFNKDSWWDDEVEVILLGDSYVDCQHIDFKDSFISQYRTQGYKALSLGIAGTGPYLQLAALKTYKPLINCRNPWVIWIYYEGNDLMDAEDEAKVPYLKDCINSNWTHKANLEILKSLSKNHKYGVENKFKRTLTLYKTRYAIKERLGFKAGSLEYQKCLKAALEYHPKILLVRIKRLGVSYDRAWNSFGAPYKLEFPADPKYYGSGITTAHLNKEGYAKLIELTKTYIIHTRLNYK